VLRSRACSLILFDSTSPVLITDQRPKQAPVDAPVQLPPQHMKPLKASRPEPPSSTPKHQPPPLPTKHCSRWTCQQSPLIINFLVGIATFGAGLNQAVPALSGGSHLSLQVHSSSAEYARELFKPSKDSPSLQVRNKISFYGFGFRFFCE